MKHPILLALFCLGIILLTAFYFISKVLYKQRHQVNYSFTRMFPYELNYPSVFKENIWGNVLFIFGCITVVVFYILNPHDSTYRVVNIALSIVQTMVFLCLLLMPLYYLRTHLVLSILAMTLSVAVTLVNLLFGYSYFKVFTDNASRVLAIISMVVSGLLALTMLVLILNPRLSFKIYLDEETDSSGNEVLKRPKVIFLALNEWVSIFILFLSPISILLLSLI